jgi:hypothetical protein
MAPFRFGQFDDKQDQSANSISQLFDHLRVFEIHARVIGWGRKWGFFEHRFEVSKIIKFLSANEKTDLVPIL